jgi:hypothetical protein
MEQLSAAPPSWPAGGQSWIRPFKAIVDAPWIDSHSPLAAIV